MFFCKKITISGAVQGVGFRPFVYNLAKQLNIFGEVYNNSAGVVIIAVCKPEQFDSFLALIKSDVPKIAEIKDIKIEDNYQNSKKYLDFSINKSVKGRVSAIVLPDICVCKDCIDDITDKNNRRYGYAFTNCTSCGPRFSIIKGIPYDRQSTSMASFLMCEKCQKEYQNPTDRRFHAQPNACPDCGPQLWLTAATGKKITTDNYIEATASLLKQGKIIAIKGVGGFHLACLASSDSAVETLRKRKNRPHKPFALMAKDVHMVKEYCALSEQEQLLLTDKASPIVLLEKINDLLSKQIAPKQKKLGLMLPYSPLHYLLLHALNAPLVLTSGNKSQQPQIIDNQQAINELSDIADYLLLHNRDIINRVDDSVVQSVANQDRVIRRARGYAPTALSLPKGFEEASGVLAVGAELKNTFCLLTNSQAIVSQYIGDLKTLESYQDFQNNIDLYQQLYQLNIKHLASDLHLDYLSSKYAQNYAYTKTLEIKKIQHHHAHICSCLFENGKAINTKKVLGVVWDGIGLGADGALWGGEFIEADYLQYNRVARFEYIPLLGGDRASSEPWRIAYAYLKKHNLLRQEFFTNQPITKLDALLKSDLPVNQTSSVGRLFDGVAFLLGICQDKISYEAQAAIELENLANSCANPSRQSAYEFDFEQSQDNVKIVKTKKMWLAIINDIKKKQPLADIAYRFHISLAYLILNTALKLQIELAFDTVVLSGGVFNNKLLLSLVDKLFSEIDSITLLTHSKIPTGDGGISLGQAAICAAKIQKA